MCEEEQNGARRSSLSAGRYAIFLTLLSNFARHLVN